MVPLPSWPQRSPCAELIQTERSFKRHLHILRKVSCVVHGGAERGSCSRTPLWAATC